MTLHQKFCYHIKMLLITCVFFLLMACSSEQPKYNDVQSSQMTLTRIEKQYQIWQNTPYVYGGDSLNGIDCSGLVMNFYQKYDITMPRTTGAQYKMGRKVNNLTAGDLLFFNTGKGNRVTHVGIYYHNGQFLHASTSKGVMYSNLNDPYWQDAFLQAKRVIN